MCTGSELALISTVASVGKTGLDFINNRSANRRQDNEAAAAIRRQSAFNKRATDAINKTLPDLGADKRGEVLQQLEDESVAKSTESLDTQRAITGGLPSNINQGRVSEDFLDARATETTRTTKRAAELARLLGRVRAPNVASQNESFGRARLATDLGQIRNFGAGQAGADELSIQAAGQTNPLLSLVSAGLGGVSAGANAKAIADARIPGTPARLTPAATPPGVRTISLPNRAPLKLRKLT